MPSKPPTPASLHSAHPLGRTICLDKTERIGAARPLYFPYNRTSRCTLGSFGGRLGYVKKKKKWRSAITDGRKNHYGVFPAVRFCCRMAGLMACDPSLSSSETPSFHPLPPLVSPPPHTPPTPLAPLFLSPLSVRSSVRPSPGQGCVPLHHR